MLLYKKIDFPQHVLDLIKRLATEQTKNYTEKKLYVMNAWPSTEEWDIINEPFRSRGLSDVAHLLCVKRTVPTAYDYKSAHVDFHPNTHNETHSTFVVPVYGYENTEHYWFKGDYEIKFDTGLVPAFIIKWNEEPEILDKFTVTDGIWLTNGSIPHNANATGNGYRLICSLRLTNNETMEEILEKFGYTE